MTRLPPDFKEFLSLLNTHGVEYLLVGGYAVNYYGYTRTTADMDVWIAVAPSNKAKLLDVLKEFGFRDSSLNAETLFSDHTMLRMGVPPLRIEVFSKLSGLTFDECYAGRQGAEMDGIPVNIIRLEDLKTNKRLAGRAKDLDDLQNL